MIAFSQIEFRLLSDPILCRLANCTSLPGERVYSLSTLPSTYMMILDADSSSKNCHPIEPTAHTGGSGHLYCPGSVPVPIASELVCSQDLHHPDQRDPHRVSSGNDSSVENHLWGVAVGVIDIVGIVERQFTLAGRTLMTNSSSWTGSSS